MRLLPNDTKQELSLQLKDVLETIESYSPDKAASEQKAWSYHFRAGSNFVGGFKAYLLGETNLTEQLFSQVIPNSRMAVAHNKISHDNRFQYALFNYALLLGDQDQIDESAKVILSLDVNKDIRFTAPTKFYLLLAHLWRGETDRALALNNELELLENKKSEHYIQPGICALVRGVVNNQVDVIREGAELVIHKHLHTTKYFKSALENNHYFSEPITLLTLLGGKFGIDVKGCIGDTTRVLKTKTFSPADRPEVPTKKKFEVPVDLVPSCFLPK